MAKYTIRLGQTVISDKTYVAGDLIELSAEQAALMPWALDPAPAAPVAEPDHAPAAPRSRGK